MRRHATAIAAAFAVAVQDGDHLEVARILAGLDRRGLNELATTLAAHLDLDQPWTRHVRRSRPPLTLIVDAAATECGVNPADLHTLARRQVATARAVACLAARTAGWSTPAIGRHLHRDHSTVIYNSRRAARDPRLAALAHAVLERVRADQQEVA